MVLSGHRSGRNVNSIRMNVSAMTALQSLQVTNKELLKTQGRISSGYRVGAAEDNAAYWSIATTMRSDNKSLSTVRDALGLGSATVDVAYTAVSSSLDVVSEIKSKLVAAREPGVDRKLIQKEVSELQNQLVSIASSATFSNQNWLSVNSSTPNYNATRSIVASFSRGGDGSVSIQTISVETSATALFDASASAAGILDGLRDSSGALASTGFSVASLDISALTDSPTDLATIESYIAGASMAVTEMTDAATTLGTTKQRIGLQMNLVNSLIGAIDRGIGILVDADMNEESTRLQAQQVQQQLGTQSLSTANGASQSILSLFRS